MALIPDKKQWTQPNDGDSLGNLSATWGINFLDNRGSVKVSNPLKSVFNTGDNANLTDPVAQYLEYSGEIFAVSGEVYKVTSDAATDITDTSNWTIDSTSGSPSPGATVTDSVVFDNLLLVQDGTDIKAYNGSSWSSWWKSTRGQTSLDTGQDFVLTVAPNGVLYIVDGGNKVYKVPSINATDPSIVKSGAGSLDFSDTNFQIINSTTTSTRIFYGTEDLESKDCAIIEWDMGASSISANKIHRMGAKRVLVMFTYNNSACAILSDGSIKIHNGSSFVDWVGVHLPKTNNTYSNEVIHKNGWAIIDELPHFLINPRVETNSDVLQEITTNEWDYPAGVYCLDPQVGLYCRSALNDGASQVRQARSVGALYSLDTQNTKFLTSYKLRNSDSTDTSFIAAEDRANAGASNAWLHLQPIESADEVVKKLNLIHKRLGTGDEMNVFYRRYNEDAVRLDGNWLNTSTFNTTDPTTGVTVGQMAIAKIGGYFLSKVKEISGDNTKSILFENTNTLIAANDVGVIEITDFKFMGKAKGGVEFTELTIPNAIKSRQVWIWIELKQAAGNNLQLDYLIS